MVMHNRLIPSKAVLFILLARVSTCFPACNGGVSLFKEVDLIYAEIEIEEIYSEDEVVYMRLNATQGSTHIIGAGFGVSKQANVAVYDDQQFVEIYESGSYILELNSLVEKLVEDETYYFIAFIIDENGLSQSQRVEFTVPVIPAPEIPCDLMMDHARHTSRSYYPVSSSISDPITEHGTYAVDIELSAGGRLSVEFAGKLLNGAYDICYFDELVPDERLAWFAFYSSNAPNVVLPGGKVYLEKVDEHNLILSFCDVQWKFKESSTDTLVIEGQTLVYY